MITLTQSDINSLSKQLSNALVNFSEGKLRDSDAEKIAYVTIQNIDFSNSALAHKGINWFAKEILKKINYDSVRI
ncbi:hypothetical protein [Bacillus cereus]|uniref:hypothetical protein n=1 Tax=Bacillus cereus TaxID=1396 RepID=UPI000BF275FB|nr:hypothetical protein [Bacillus cereus]PEZ29499.1 hypothetical protein CN361_28205 [Bacillus cereus]